MHFIESTFTTGLLLWRQSGIQCRFFVCAFSPKLCSWQREPDTDFWCLALVILRHYYLSLCAVEADTVHLYVILLKYHYIL